MNVIVREEVTAKRLLVTKKIKQNQNQRGEKRQTASDCAASSIFSLNDFGSQKVSTACGDWSTKLSWPICVI